MLEPSKFCPRKQYHQYSRRGLNTSVQYIFAPLLHPKAMLVVDEPNPQ